jgi:hypothetical protein
VAEPCCGGTICYAEDLRSVAHASPAEAMFATPVDCPSEGDGVGVRFKLGTFWPAFLPGTLRDRRDVTLPGASTRSFWLNRSAWEYPTYENADTFVARLVHKGLIARDPVVETVLDGGRHGVSVRSLIGQTPSEVARATRQLSFLYKTTSGREFYGESEGGRLDALHHLIKSAEDTNLGPPRPVLFQAIARLGDEAKQAGVLWLGESEVRRMIEQQPGAGASRG